MMNVNYMQRTEVYTGIANLKRRTSLATLTTDYLIKTSGAFLSAHFYEKHSHSDIASLARTFLNIVL